MIELANKYKDISLDIINKLKNKDIEEINELLDIRQNILDDVTNSKQFKEILFKENILDIDENIKSLLKEQIEHTKEEIKEHNRSKKASMSYINIGKENLNIFNKKV
ncbi:MAG: flagellar protein FliT [Paraclostridium bifermentans]|uniref:flagellar protein FliT n=1 Tax=Paraclostridium bifermentans TaxID=1490 RepID=UPI001E0FD3CF|nr:flagellar protein FliT [Paraclostridium bifermentans]MBS6506834.1 flagellar protein FliT [Paraclostridium bifermentans]